MNSDFFAQQRKLLISDLEKKGINDNTVLNAFAICPRELFIDDYIQHKAYQDNALPIDCNQTISQPFTVAYMMQHLNLENGLKVLEIGTGSGYQAALLKYCGVRVYTVERIRTLHNQSNELFRKLKLDINSKHSDGTLGWTEEAPFDRIIVTAASPAVPHALINQLAENGIMIIPVGDKDVQKMQKIKKYPGGSIDTEVLDSFRFVPLIGEDGWTR